MNAYELSKFSLQFVIICLNVSIIAFVWCERRNYATFRSSFFVLFTAVSVSECLHTTTWLIEKHFPNTFGMVDLFVTHLPCKLYILPGTALVFQALAHSAIAFNRFCCWCPQERMQLFLTSRSACISIFLITLTSLLAILPSLISPCRHNVFKGRIVGAMPTDFTLYMVRTSIMVATYAFTTLSEFMYTWLTVRLLVRIRREGRLNSRRHEIGLFVYSMVMCSLQALLFVNYVVGLTLSGTVVQQVMTLVFNYGLGDAYSMIGPLCLLILSRDIRARYLRFYKLKQGANHSKKLFKVTVTITSLRRHVPPAIA